MSLLDYTLDNIVTFFASLGIYWTHDLGTIISIILILLLLAVFLRGMYRLLKGAQARGLDTRNILHWPPHEQFSIMMGFYLVLMSTMIVAILLVFDSLQNMIVALAQVFVVAITIVLVSISFDNLSQAKTSLKQSKEIADQALEQTKIERRINHIRTQLEEFYSPITSNGDFIKNLSSRREYEPTCDKYHRLFTQIRVKSYLASPTLRTKVNQLSSLGLSLSDQSSGKYMDYDTEHLYNNTYQEVLINVEQEYNELLDELNELVNGRDA